MNAPGGLDPIRRACQTAGCYTLSAGTSKPTVVLTRLLDALAILDPEVHRGMEGPEGVCAAIPPDALGDELNAWWSSEEANAVLQRVFGAINDAAPDGFACMYSVGDRLELARIDAARNAEEPSAQPSSCVSAVRWRVRPSEREP